MGQKLESEGLEHFRDKVFDCTLFRDRLHLKDRNSFHLTVALWRTRCVVAVSGTVDSQGGFILNPL